MDNFVFPGLSRLRLSQRNEARYREFYLDKLGVPLDEKHFDAAASAAYLKLGQADRDQFVDEWHAFQLTLE